MTKNQFIIYIATVVIGGGIASCVGARLLDQATAKQCLQHDWPKSAHQIHMKWCASNGYKTN